MVLIVACVTDVVVVVVSGIVDGMVVVLTTRSIFGAVTGETATPKQSPFLLMDLIVDDNDDND